jgi:hypothetical protein
MANPNFFQVANAIIPSVFTPLAIERTKELTEFVRSGIVQDDPVINSWMSSSIGAGGGSQTLNRPTWNDLDASDGTGTERTGDDSQSVLYGGAFAPFPVPLAITQHNEIAVRVDRNMHWAASALAAVVSGAKNPDAIGVIGQLVGTYWSRRFQKYVLAILAGVLADNDAAPTGGDTHTQFDLTFDVSGSSFVPGVTNFTAEALYDTLQTLGDADSQITNIAVHSAVRNRMRKNNLIDVIRDSEGNYMFDSFQGLRLTVDDGMPKTGNVYDSYLFGPGFLHYGTSAPENATTTVWRDEAGNGQGSDELWNRVSWCVHPMGHQFIGSLTSKPGGPTNATSANNLANAASWSRVAQTRKNVPFARLRTREA